MGSIEIYLRKHFNYETHKYYSNPDFTIKMRYERNEPKSIESSTVDNS